MAKDLAAFGYKPKDFYLSDEALEMLRLKEDLSCSELSSMHFFIPDDAIASFPDSEISKIVDEYKDLKYPPTIFSFMNNYSDCYRVDFKEYIMKSKHYPKNFIGFVFDNRPNQVFSPEFKTIDGSYPSKECTIIDEFNELKYWAVKRHLIREKCEKAHTEAMFIDWYGESFKQMGKIPTLIEKYSNLSFSFGDFEKSIGNFEKYAAERRLHIVFVSARNVKTIGLLKNDIYYTTFGNFNETYCVDLGVFLQYEYNKYFPWDIDHALLEDVEKSEKDVKDIQDKWLEDRLKNKKYGKKDKTAAEKKKTTKELQELKNKLQKISDACYRPSHENFTTSNEKDE